MELSVKEQSLVEDKKIIKLEMVAVPSSQDNSKVKAMIDNEIDL